jgi:hypothetical protein
LGKQRCIDTPLQHLNLIDRHKAVFFMSNFMGGVNY